MTNSDPYASIKIHDYRRFVFARFLLTMGIQMQSVIVGWQIYKLTHDALSLGLIGLSEAIPFLCVSLYAGHVADIVNRKKIVVISNMVYVFCAFSLLLIATQLHWYLQNTGVYPIYIIIFISGLARSFMSPSQTAFGAQLIPRELYGNASTWNSMTWHVAEISGPAVGGLVYGFFGVGPAYFVVLCLSSSGWLLFSMIKKRPMPENKREESVIQSLSTGLKFVFENQVILSAISLDMFAVFFGGAVSVLPIFADQVFHIGAEGLGFLRAAPAFGAVIMSFAQAHRPPFRKAGRNLLIGVAGFGICIILFALLRNLYIVFFVLLLSGMFDNISVVIRHTIIQISAPEEMRGRISSINGIFIGSSNELGSFESGVAAKFLGLIPSVIFGGTMTLGVVGIVAKVAPKLRKLNLNVVKT